MSGFSSSATTPASPEQVWRVLTDWTRGLRWRPGMEAVEVTGEGLGSTLSWTCRGSPRPAVITEWAPHHTLTVHYSQGPVEADYRWTLTSQGTHTLVSLTVSTHAQGAARLMLPVFTEMMRRSDEALPTHLCTELR